MCRFNILNIGDSKNYSLGNCWLHQNSNPRLFGKIFTYKVNLFVNDLKKLYPIFKQKGFPKIFEDYIKIFKNENISYNFSEVDAHFFYCCLEEICIKKHIEEKFENYQWVINTVDMCEFESSIVDIQGKCTRFKVNDP